MDNISLRVPIHVLIKLCRKRYVGGLQVAGPLRDHSVILITHHRPYHLYLGRQQKHRDSPHTHSRSGPTFYMTWASLRTHSGLLIKRVRPSSSHTGPSRILRCHTLYPQCISNPGWIPVQFVKKGGKKTQQPPSLILSHRL